MRTSPLVTIAFIFAASTLAAAAQTASSSAAAAGTAKSAGNATEPKPVENVTVHFQTKSMTSPVSGVYYRSGNTSISLSAQPGVLSKSTYIYTGNPTMDLYSAAGGAPKKVGSITFSKSGNYIVFLNGDANAVGGAALTDDTTDFPVGSVRFVNCTNIPLSMKQIGTTEPDKSLRPYGVVLLRFKGTDHLILTFNRTDLDPPVTVTGTQLAPLGVRIRDTEFISVGNPLEVYRDGAQPSFNIISAQDNPQSTAQAAAMQRATRGRATTRGTGG